MSNQKLESKIRVATYLRVSSDQQDVKMQREEIAIEIEKMGYKLINEYADESIKGTDTEREALSRLISDAKMGLFDIVICYKIDRIARDVRLGLNILHEIEQAGVSVIILKEPMLNTNSAAYKMLRTAILMGAEMEYESIKTRTRSAKLAWIKANKWPSAGLIPFGYKITSDYQLEIHEDNTQIVKKIFRMYVDEDMSIRKIVETLNKEQVPSGTKNGWKKDRVQAMLVNQIYTGKGPIKGKKLGYIHDFICPPIISEETFNRIRQRKLERVARSKRNTKRDYPFAGILRCAGCGFVLHSITSRNNYTENYFYGFTRRPSDKHIPNKRCPDHGCGRISERTLVEALNKNFIEFLVNSSVEEIEKWLIDKNNNKPSEEIDALIKEVEAELNILRGKWDNVIEAFFDGVIDKVKRDKKLSEIQELINIRQGKIHGLRQLVITEEEKREKFKRGRKLAETIKSIYNNNSILPELDYKSQKASVIAFLPLIEIIYVDFKDSNLQVHMRDPYDKKEVVRLGEEVGSNRIKRILPEKEILLIKTNSIVSGLAN